MSTVLMGVPGAYGLRQEGIITNVIVTGPLGSVNVPAMIDTGSIVSSVDSALLTITGADISGSETIDTVIGIQTVPIAKDVSILTPNNVNLTAGVSYVLSDSLPKPGPRVLIGRDILANYALIYYGTGSWDLETLESAPSGPSGTPLLGLLGLAFIGSAAAVGSYRLVRGRSKKHHE